MKEATVSEPVPVAGLVGKPGLLQIPKRCPDRKAKDCWGDYVGNSLTPLKPRDNGRRVHPCDPCIAIRDAEALALRIRTGQEPEPPKPAPVLVRPQPTFDLRDNDD